MFRPWRAFLLLLALVGLVVLIYANQRGIIHLLGIDTQQSDNYDFFSGVGPVVVTGIGYTGMIAGLWHHVNCHASGCWRIGRHKVDGTPWCNAHQLSARAVSKANIDEAAAKLDQLLEVSAKQIDLLSKLSGRYTDTVLSEMQKTTPQLPDDSA